MKRVILYFLTLLFSLFLNAQEHQFTDEIKAFQKEDKINPPKDGVVLFLGSSTFRLWKNVKTDLKNPDILNRAFGGATLPDVIYFEKDVAFKYSPKKIVIYCGENDIANSDKTTPKMVLKNFKTLYKNLRSHFPTTPIVFISLKPCISRWTMKDRMFQTNRLISAYLYKKKNAEYVNVWDAMLENGYPKKDIFLQDNLHMNEKGYAIWSEILMDVVNN